MCWAPHFGLPPTGEPDTRAVPPPQGLFKAVLQGASGGLNTLTETWSAVTFLVVPTPWPLWVHIPTF